MSKTIQITCTGAALIPLSKLEHFQGNLKTLSEKEYKKLRQSIERSGFSFPLFVWKDKMGRYKIIDGHQRFFTVQQMLKEGYVLESDGIPVDWIEARSEKEAKEKVLLADSQYGRYDEETVYTFIGENGLDWPELKLEIDLPQINMGKLAVGYFKDEQIEEPKAKIVICPNCGEEFTP